MSAARIRSPQRKTSRKKLKPKATSASRRLKLHQFLGLSLCGGKTEKTCLAVIDYYPDHRKIFLSKIVENFEAEKGISSDLALHNLLSFFEDSAESLAVNVPLRLPKCITCKLKCPGVEACKVPEVQWMNKHYKKLNLKRKPERTFTPYTERCAELYISKELEEVFHVPHALGANMAPLTARAHFVMRRLKFKTLEIFPKLSLWRIGRSLGVPKSYLRYHKHSVSGDESRSYILSQLVEKNIAFIYEQDFRIMVQNNVAFEAFLAALTGVLQFRGEVEKRPKDFPKSASWIEIPKDNLTW